jgi:hypothetical protein
VLSSQQNETRNTPSYPLLARDDAVPQQQVNGTIGQLLWLGDEALKHAKANTAPLSNREELLAIQISNRISLRTCGWLLRQDLRSSARRQLATSPDAIQRAALVGRRRLLGSPESCGRLHGGAAAVSGGHSSNEVKRKPRRGHHRRGGDSTAQPGRSTAAVFWSID